MSKRIEWLDIAKGLGILMVVAGHCVAINDPLCQLMFVFHMPLFFFLSGYTYSAKKSIPATIAAKAKTLLLPFYAFFAVGLATVLAIPAWRDNLTWDAVKFDLIFCNPNSAQNSSIWFLVCLFFVAVIYRVMEKLPAWVKGLIVLFLFLLCVRWSMVVYNTTDYSYTTLLGNRRLPFTLDIVPAGLLFYALGHAARQGKLMDKITRHWWSEAALAVVGTVVTLWVYRENGYVNINALQFGNPMLYVLGGLSGTAAVMAVSALIARLKNGALGDGKRILLWYGRNSLLVLGFQSLLIRLYIYVFNTYQHTALGLYAFPWSHAINSMILVAFVFCPLIIGVIHLPKTIRTSLTMKKES